MSQPFPFARAFEPDQRRMAPLEKAEPTLTLSEHQSLLALAAADGEARGRLAGLQEAAQESERRLAMAMEQIAAALAASEAQLGRIERAASMEAVHFASRFADLLAGHLLRKHPVESLVETARGLFADLRGVPHIVARVPAELTEQATERLKAVAREAGIEARLVVLGEPDVMAGDVVIEWADGGLARNRAETLAMIETAVHRAYGSATP
jgi:flagellar assembly protein FliH